MRGGGGVNGEEKVDGEQRDKAKRMRKRGQVRTRVGGKKGVRRRKMREYMEGSEQGRRGRR